MTTKPSEPLPDESPLEAASGPPRETSTTARLISLSVVTTLIVFLGITFFQVIAPFLLPLFLAGVVAMLCRPLQQRLAGRIGGERRAAGLTTALVLLLVLIPVTLTVTIIAVRLGTFVSTALEGDAPTRWVEQVQAELQMPRIMQRIEPLLGSGVDRQKVEQEIRRSAETASEWLAGQTVALGGVAVGLVGGIVAALVQLGMFVIALYYFLVDGPALVRAAEGLIPVQMNHQQKLIEQFQTTTRAVIAGTFLAALVQGLVASVLLYLFGFRQFFILLPLTAFCSLIPLFGTALVWGPCAVWLLVTGDVWQAVALVALGAGLIGTLDNVVRAYVLQSDAKLHPLLAFVCVLGGIQVMGLWGVFIGPLVASILHALILIFNAELAELSRDRTALAPAAGPAAGAGSDGTPPDLTTTPERSVTAG